MKAIEKGEIYQHLSGFLKNKGIELTEGSYSKKIEKSCGLLAETINLSQKGLERAKQGIDEKLDQVRQAIHEKTAPKSAAPVSGPAPAAATAPAAEPATKGAPQPKKARKAAPKGAVASTNQTPKGQGTKRS